LGHEVLRISADPVELESGERGGQSVSTGADIGFLGPGEIGAIYSSTKSSSLTNAERQVLIASDGMCPE
jgi:hypothetical protein